jgi:hypothetical protein
MKHLRKFNESSVEDMKSNIEDILSELSDRYIPVDVFLSTVVCQKVCSIQLGDEYADLDMIRIVPKDNKDEFLRIYDYMESEGYDFSSMSYDSSGVSGDWSINIVTLRIVDIGLGIDAFSNHLFNGIDETCYLKLFFRKKK